MKKYFVFSDVHSFYVELMTALTDNGFDINNPEHIIISCGDLLDRGPYPEECLDFVNNMYDKGRAILIKGNHDDMIDEILDCGYFRNHDYHNCTVDTFYKLSNANRELYLDAEGLPIDDTIVISNLRHNEKWKKYRESLIDYYELDDYIFVHGWIPVGLEVEDLSDKGVGKLYWPTKNIYTENWRTPTWNDDWKDARWLCGFKQWEAGIVEPGKTIVCGHWHTSYAHTKYHNDGHEYPLEFCRYWEIPEEEKESWTCNFGIFYDEGIIGIDACTAISNQVNILVIEK